MLAVELRRLESNRGYSVADVSGSLEIPTACIGNHFAIGVFRATRCPGVSAGLDLVIFPGTVRSGAVIVNRILIILALACLAYAGGGAWE
jgi:hypothetical protein